MDDEGGAHILLGDLLIVVQAFFGEDHLDALEAAAVVELDKPKVLHVADGTGPAADGHGLTVVVFHVRKDAGDFRAFHVASVLSGVK